MIFSKEEEIFSTVNTSNVSVSEEDNATNLPDSSTKGVNDNNEVGQGKQNAKRKSLDEETAKKVCHSCPVLLSINEY